MAASTGPKPAEGFPKALWNMLNVLLDENGLRSWQIYSDNQGVSVRMRFNTGENGGQNGQVTSGQKVTFSKKSPSQNRRDEKRVQERRITRQMARNDDEVEKPRTCDTGYIDTGSHALFSPASVDSSISGQMNDLDPFKCGHSPVPVNDQTSSTGVMKQDLDLSDTVYKQSDHAESADHMCHEEGPTGPATQDTSDAGSEGSESDLSLPVEEYHDPRPREAKCSYCGKTFSVSVCKYEECGRKVCVYCSFNYKRHRRHHQFIKKR